jgi:ketol-acid reductoisomerase
LTARIYTDKDADLRWLKGKISSVIGFGAQGRAHALNLQDSGIDVIVGLYPGSKSRARARRSGLRVVDTPEAVRRGDIIFSGAFRYADAGHLPETDPSELASRCQTLLFAHGFAIHYRTIVPPKDIDVVMVAPKGLGPMVRREFVHGRGVPALIAVHQDRSRHAKRTALAWAKGIGCTRAGVLETTFREETETDLFGEQAVLCGGTSAHIRAGYPPELAYFECLHELKFIVDLIHEAGLTGMRRLISDTAKWGELTVGPKIIDQTVQKHMRSALRDIRSGKFAREFIREMRTGARRRAQLLRKAEAHPIEKVGARLRSLMRWK